MNTMPALELHIAFTNEAMLLRAELVTTAPDCTALGRRHLGELRGRILHLEAEARKASELHLAE